MKKYILLFLSVLFLFSCSDEIPEEKLPVESGRTILAYLVSNNAGGNLDKYLKQNLVDMYAGLAMAEDTCTLLVYYRPYDYDDEGFYGPSILKFTSDGHGNINNKPALDGKDIDVADVISASFLVSYEGEKNHNATDPKTMQRIFKKMTELCPSESYGLIFGSHGTSWMPGNKYAGRAFGDDEGYNIDIPEMANVLGSVFKKPLDFILFDACMMCTAEVCYEFKDITNCIVGSVVETHVIGNPYAVIIPELFEGEINYAGICRDYIDYSKKLDVWGVSAAIDCSKMEELASWVKDNIGKYSGELSEFDLDDVQQYGVSNYKYFSFDIVDLFTKLNNGTTPADLTDLMDNVVIAKDALCGLNYKVVGQLLIEEGHYCGIGMYLPGNPQINRTKWDEYYKKSISWYNAVGWKDFSYQQNQ